MTKDEALKELLEIVEHAISSGDWKVDGACDPEMIINCAKKALALSEKQHTFPDKKQPAQEPVAFELDDLTEEYIAELDDKTALIIAGGNRKSWTNKIYTHPQAPSPWQGFTDSEIDAITCVRFEERAQIRAIEQALKEKNT